MMSGGCIHVVRLRSESTLCVGTVSALLYCPRGVTGELPEATGAPVSLYCPHISMRMHVLDFGIHAYRGAVAPASERMVEYDRASTTAEVECDEARDSTSEAVARANK